MLKIFIITLAIASTLCNDLAGLREDQLLTKFHEFIAKYNKNYKSLNEFNARFKAFKDNIGKLTKFSATRK